MRPHISAIDSRAEAFLSQLERKDNVLSVERKYYPEERLVVAEIERVGEKPVRLVFKKNTNYKDLCRSFGVSEIHGVNGAYGANKAPQCTPA